MHYNSNFCAVVTISDLNFLNLVDFTELLCAGIVASERVFIIWIFTGLRDFVPLCILPEHLHICAFVDIFVLVPPVYVQYIACVVFLHGSIFSFPRLRPAI